MATKKGGKGKGVPTSDDNTLTDEAPSQFVAPSSPESSFSILTEEEAERKGDFTALLRIRLANAAREVNEHMDVNGDGVVAGSLSPGGGHDSVLFARDEYGGYYAKDGYYHDKFGGFYDDYGYHDKSGSYTTNSGAHWDAKTGKMTNADGTERTVSSETVREQLKKDPKLGETITTIDEQFNQEQNGGESKPKVDTAGAASTAGGGRGRVQKPTSAETREKTEIVMEEREAEGRDLHGPSSAAERKRANEIYKNRHRHINNQRGELTNFIAAQSTAPATSAELKQANEAFSQRGGGHGKTTFKAVSKEEAQAALGRIHVPVKEGAHVHTSADHGGAADHDHDEHGSTPAAKADGETKPKDQKANAATTPGGNWYADSKGGFWDEYGGYYDKDGGYWEFDGGYWDKYNVYTDVNGGRTWPDKSYLDPNFNYVDKDGCYWTDDGTKIKPPAGMDFKKQMQEAAAKHEKWHLPEELVPLITSKVPAPDLMKSTAPITQDLASSLTPIKLTDPKAGDAPKTDPVTPVLSPVKLNTNLELLPPKLTSGFDSSPAAAGTSFSLLDPKRNSTPASPENNFNVDQSQFQMCTAQSSPKNDFSSFFNNYHDFLSSAKPETKFYDLSNITWSPSIDTKTQLAVLTTPADNKTAVPPPKLA